MDRLSENAQVAASGKCSIKKWAKDSGLYTVGQKIEKDLKKSKKVQQKKLVKSKYCEYCLIFLHNQHSKMEMLMKILSKMRCR